MEEPRGSRRVNILARPIRLAQRLAAREMRQKTQFDLRIVGVHEHVPLSCDKEFPQFPAHIRADGNVLQIGICAGKPPRRRHRLIIRRMHDAVFDERTNPVHIGGLQFLHLAVLQDEPRDLVLFGKFFQNFRAGGITAADILFDPFCAVSEFFKEHFRELEGRIEIERRNARKLENARGKLRHRSLEFFGKDGKFAHIDAHADSLHFDKHARKRQFEIAIELLLRRSLRLFQRIAIGALQRAPAAVLGHGVILRERLCARRTEIGIDQIP